MPKQYGLIGYPLSHSFSQSYFSNKFKNENISESEYHNFPIDSIDKLPLILKDNLNLLGLNVTIPYKESVIPYLNEIDEVAEQIGAVNTIVIKRIKGEIVTKGYNTDAFGFAQSIKPFFNSLHSKALILGTGGASKAVAYVLKNLGVEVNFASTKPTKGNVYNYADLNAYAIGIHKFIINTTPLGMYPKIEECPSIDYAGISKEHLLVDLIYNPEKTIFLKEGEKKNALILNGLPMLKAQAENAWEIWNA